MRRSASIKQAAFDGKKLKVNIKNGLIFKEWRKEIVCVSLRAVNTSFLMLQIFIRSSTKVDCSVCVIVSNPFFI